MITTALLVLAALVSPLGLPALATLLLVRASRRRRERLAARAQVGQLGEVVITLGTEFRQLTDGEQREIVRRAIQAGSRSSKGAFARLVEQESEPVLEEVEQRNRELRDYKFFGGPRPAWLDEIEDES